MANSEVVPLEIARKALIEMYAPAARCRRVAWSHGTTEAIEQGTGAPLLFLHGGLGQGSDWLPLWPHLNNDHRLITIDRPGHGLSDPFDYRGVAFLDHAVEFLVEVMDELALARVPIVANSMGGRWALELGLRHPERVEQLILVGAPAGSSPRVPMQLPMTRWPIVHRIVRRVFARSTPEGARASFSKLLVKDAKRVPEQLFIAAAASQRRNVDSLMRFIERIVTRRAIRPELVIEDLWRQLEVPVTFIWGDADAFDLPATGRAAAALCRDATMIELRDVGHLPWLEDAASVASAIDAALGDSKPLAPALAV